MADEPEVKDESTEPGGEKKEQKLLDLRDARVRTFQVMRVVVELEEELDHVMPKDVRVALMDKLDPILQGCYATGRAVEAGLLPLLPDEEPPHDKSRIILPKNAGEMTKQ